MSTTAVFADTIDPVGDEVNVAQNINYQDPSPNHQDCDARGSGVTGQIDVTRQGNSGHLFAGEGVTVTFTAPTGISVTYTATSVPTGSSWDSNGDSFSIPISTTTATSVAHGSYQVGVHLVGNTSSYAPNDKSYSVIVDETCVVDSGNTAPDVAADNATVTVTEGATAQNTGTASDDDDDSVTLSASVGSVTDNLDGTWSWTFGTTDGPAQSQPVTITADDGTDESTATFALVVNNADPVVASPVFGSSMVCQGASVSLTGLSFSDAGVDDDPWALGIDWGDGSTDYSDAAVASQGAYASQGHTYNIGGPYTATVDVTDKDGGTGSNTSSNSVTVVAHYSLTFLQPVDGTTNGSVSNAVKLGRVVPVKVLIRDNCAANFAGAYVTDPATLVRIRAGLAPTVGGTLLDAVEQYADAGYSNSDTLYLRWTADATAAGGGFWIYNLDTKNFSQTQFESTKTYRIAISIGGVLATGSSSQYALLKMVK